jgi:hypothetical protein
VRTGHEADTEVPLYARMLQLRHVHPGALLCFLLLEGTIAVAALLALAELASWWAVPVLPLTVAGMVKINDLVAGAVCASPRLAPVPALALARTPAGPVRQRPEWVALPAAAGHPRPVGLRPVALGVQVTAPMGEQRRGRHSAEDGDLDGKGRVATAAVAGGPAAGGMAVGGPVAGGIVAAGMATGARTNGGQVGRDEGGQVSRENGRVTRKAAGDLENECQDESETSHDGAVPGVTNDDPPVDSRPSVDSQALPDLWHSADGTVYGVRRPVDDDATPARGWASNTVPLEPDRVGGRPPEQPRGRNPIEDRPPRSLFDDNNSRYRGGLNQGRF